jgi:branched-chain amino acid transport system substrate-binding protein
MITRLHLLRLAASAAVVSLAGPALAQNTIKIGELNSYKSQPAFLDPYKKGWELAIEAANRPPLSCVTCRSISCI